MKAGGAVTVRQLLDERENGTLLIILLTLTGARANVAIFNNCITREQKEEVKVSHDWRRDCEILQRIITHLSYFVAGLVPPHKFCYLRVFKI